MTRFLVHHRNHNNLAVFRCEYPLFSILTIFFHELLAQFSQHLLFLWFLAYQSFLHYLNFISVRFLCLTEDIYREDRKEFCHIVHAGIKTSPSDVLHACLYAMYRLLCAVALPEWLMVQIKVPRSPMVKSVIHIESRTLNRNNVILEASCRDSARTCSLVCFLNHILCLEQLYGYLLLFKLDLLDAEWLN